MDRLQSALNAVTPLLKEMEAGLRRKPRASAPDLERLRTLRVEPATSEPASLSQGSQSGKSTDPTSPAIIASRGDWTMDTLREAALRCQQCPHLVLSRKQVVFGVGNPHADLMFVGEAPGADEDAQGEPFVGKAGQLLTKIIQTMGYTRETVYIGNVLKCRPDMPAGSTGNRKPRPEEMQTCFPWLKKQIELVKPKVLVALGATAVEGLIGDTRPMRELRGRWLDHHGIPLIATYHPAYLLRNQSITEKRKVWEDMLLVLEKLGDPITEKQRAYFTK